MQKELLNGSIALFERLRVKRATEGRIELALCFYRQGLFGVGRATLMRVLNELCDDNSELRSLALIRLASLERHAGKLNDALARLTESTAIVDVVGPWATGRAILSSTYKDLATFLSSTYKDLATLEEVEDLLFVGELKDALTS